MSGYTRGPWKVGRHLGSRQEVRLIHFDAGGKGRGIEVIEGAVTEADARLIAAAPDLLEALQDIISWIPNEAAMARLGFLTEFPELSRKKAVAAIAKALTTTPESN